MNINFSHFLWFTQNTLQSLGNKFRSRIYWFLFFFIQTFFYDLPHIHDKDSPVIYVFYHKRAISFFHSICLFVYCMTRWLLLVKNPFNSWQCNALQWKIRCHVISRITSKKRLIRACVCCSQQIYRDEYISN